MKKPKSDSSRRSQLYKLEMPDGTTIVTAIPYVRYAVRDLIASLAALEIEMRAFTLPTPAKIEAGRQLLREQWPHRGIRIEGQDRDATIKEMVEKKFSYEQAFRDTFNSRFMQIALPLVVNSAVLVEATINLLLKVGLKNSDRLDLYDGIERIDVAAKWSLGPAVFVHGYLLDKSKAHYSDLVKLVKHRNSFLHAKSEICDPSGKKLNESHKELRLDLGSSGRSHLRSFASLSDRLVDQLLDQIGHSDLRANLSLCKLDFF